jgi:solute carrier family 35 protein F1/2
MRVFLCHDLIEKSKAVLLGQLLAFWLASTGLVQSKLHLDCNLSAPMFSTLSFYIPLSVVFIGLLIREERRNSVQQKYSSALADIDDEFAMPVEVDDHSNLENRDEKTIQSTNNTGDTSSGGNISRMIGAKPEKRNHLLSRWSEGAGSSSSLDETTEDRSLNMVDICDIPGGADDDSNHYSQTSIPNRPYTLLGIIPLRLPKRKYALVAIFDVYANYTTILAYKYTTITDVALFDAMAIPSSIIVSRCFFGRKYTKIHFFAVLACGVGIALNVWQDYREDEKVAAEDDSLESDQEKYIAAEYPHKVAGDALAILGGILFGISNTLAEVTIKDSSLIEYLGLMTLFASIIASIQAIFTERGEIITFYGQSSSSSSASDATTCTKAEGELFFSLFAIGGMVTYAGVAFFLQISDAAFFTLSLLTGDAWSVIFSIFAEGIKPPPTFYIALAITLSGVIIYENAPSPVIDSQKQDDMGDLQLTETNNNSNSNSNGSSSSSSTSRGLAVRSREKQNEENEFVITDDDYLDNERDDFVIT